MAEQNENRTEPLDNAAAQTAGVESLHANNHPPAQSPAEHASRGFARCDEKAVDRPGNQPSPLFIVTEPLAASPLPATPTPK